MRPLPGRKAPNRSRLGYYGANYPARRRCACAGLGGDHAAGETAHPGLSKTVGPVRRQPPPGSKAAAEPSIPPGGAALARA
ncbi:hypothetical protein NUKP66_00520 [Klebsiella variicola]|nr:hypothetical protein NUKP66_00520 [Klebsiella variicola]